HRVVVGPREALLTQELVLSAVNWLGDVPLDASPEGVEVEARVRSTRPPRPARVYARDGVVRVTLAEGENGVAPGQACVFYDGAGTGARLLGGGFIARAEHDREAEAALRRLAGLPVSPVAA